jgi:hypothetical protein
MHQNKYSTSKKDLADILSIAPQKKILSIEKSIFSVFFILRSSVDAKKIIILTKKKHFLSCIFSVY